MKITYIEIDNACYRYYYGISKKIIAEIKEKLEAAGASVEVK